MSTTAEKDKEIEILRELSNTVEQLQLKCQQLEQNSATQNSNSTEELELLKHVSGELTKCN